MFKKITKGSGDSWDDVARRVYGTPDKAGDIAKMNNDLASGSILAAEEETENTE